MNHARCEAAYQWLLVVAAVSTPVWLKGCVHGTEARAVVVDAASAISDAGRALDALGAAVLELCADKPGDARCAAAGARLESAAAAQNVAAKYADAALELVP